MDKLKFAIISIVGLVIVTLVLSPAIVPIQFWVISVLLTTLIAWKLSQKNNQSSGTPSGMESVTINSCDGMNQLRRANFNEEGVSKILNEYYHKLLTYSAGKDSYMALIIDV